MKYLIYILLVISLNLLISCSCNVAENYKMLDLIIKQPDSVWSNIQNKRILLYDSIRISKSATFIRLLSHLKKSYKESYEILWDECDQYSETNEYIHRILVCNTLDPEEKILFIFMKKDKHWMFDSWTSDPHSIDRIRIY